MIQFFVKHKKVRGVITVFLTMIYLTVYMFIGFLVDGGRIRMAKTAAEDAQQIATENIMANYNKGLYEYYGLFGTSDYDVGKISDEIKLQLEESVGMKALDESLKGYTKDLPTYNSLDKRFNPYRFSVDNITTNYIDLTDVEALRAQIRDEMRYTAPLVMGADFFETIHTFISLINGIDALLDVTNKIKNNSNDIELHRKNYQNALDDFSLKYKDFVTESYKPSKTSWGRAVDGFLSFLGFFTSSSTVEYEENKKDIETDMNLKGEDGLLKIIDRNKDKENVLLYYKDFDKSSDWPQPSEYTEEDDDGNKHYDQDAHRAAVYDEAIGRARNYKNEIDKVLMKATATLNALNETINPNINEYMQCISIVEKEFQDGCQKVINSKIASNIYMQYMIQQLMAWNSLSEQKSDLSSIKLKLEAIIDILNDAKHSVDSLCSEIAADVNEDWHRPSDGQKIEQSNRNMKNNFNEKMVSIASESDGMRTAQDSAETETFFEKIKDCVNNLRKSALKTYKDYTHTIEDDIEVLGTISSHEESENNQMYNLEKLLGEEINDDNIIDKMREIIDWVKGVLESVQYELFASIYDETYILSHCRDYVHSYRYEEEELFKQSDLVKKLNNIDTVLNPKFVEDRSKTNYLSDKQLKKLAVTPAEIEYILFGEPETYKDVKHIYNNIFAIKFVLNCISACTTKEFPKMAGGPQAIILVPLGLLLYALPKTNSEMKKIMFKCEKVNIISLFGSIFDPGIESITDPMKDFFEDFINNQVEDAYSGNVEELLNAVRNNNINPEDINITNAEDFLRTNATDIFMQDVETWKSIVKAIPTDMDGLIDTVLPKAGYTHYLTMFLYNQSRYNKKVQISRLQDVIETNMSKSYAGQESFRLKSAYSQISVESECSISYIFMTNSLMGKAFRSAESYKDNKYAIKVKTAFAY